MKHLLPTNGRIVIIDDQLHQAEPLIKILSQRQLPHTYFSGEVKYLPEENSLSDIRLLFLDINLIDDTIRQTKELKGRLVPVLKKVISEDNYPYLLIYWSRQERDQKLIEEDIFKDELSSRRPIDYISAMKSDFFTMEGDKTEDFEEKLDGLFDLINEKLKEHPAYSYLLNWEGQAHKATNQTLQEIFGSYREANEWSNNANHIINSLSTAYLGKNRFKNANPQDRLKGCFSTFNSIYFDTLEATLYSLEIPESQELTSDLSNLDQGIFTGDINYRINMASDGSDICEPGVVFEYTNQDKTTLFNTLLHTILSLLKMKEDTRNNNQCMTVEIFNKIVDKKFKELRKEIRKTWINIGLIVTPLCDYAQGKKKYDRVVKGILIEAKYLKWVDDKSEAIFTSPIFRYNEKDYLMVLDFRYFVTKDLKGWSNKILFRVRQQLLAEIQSKLARHINRQGVLYIPNNE